MENHVRPSRVVLSHACGQAIRSHGIRGYPLEVCGMVIGRIHDGTWWVERIIEAANVWEEIALEPGSGAGTRTRFAISPVMILEVERELKNDNLEIIGFYHSHPDHPARPSATDCRYLWPGVVHVICSVHDGRAEDLTVWYREDEERDFESVVLNIV